MKQNLERGVRGRRERTLTRLEHQLKTNKKKVKDEETNVEKYVELFEKDIKRINKEIETLKSRI